MIQAIPDFAILSMEGKRGWGFYTGFVPSISVRT